MLADDIRAAVGSKDDHFDSLKLVVQSIDKAQRFVIGDDVVAAATELLRSKPSSLLSALPLCRLPYPYMWLEWAGEHAQGIDATGPLRDGAHKVRRMGCWLHGSDNGRVGSAFYAWQDPEGSISYGGIGFLFSFAEGGDLSGLYKILGAVAPSQSIEDVRKVNNPVSPWTAYVQASDSEAQAIIDLNKRCIALPCPWALPIYKMLLEQGRSREDSVVRQVEEGWANDINGEASFLFAMLMLLNSKNAVEQHPVDLTKLNRNRAKLGRVPKYDHAITRLSISRGQVRQGEARGMDRQAVRRHLVRGHFKIRRTGVYWWSAFARGVGRLVPRDHYDVRK